MPHLTENATPFGYLRNGAGHLVPAELVSEIDKTRNDLVLDIVAKAIDLRVLLGDFKADTFGDIQAFAELSAEKYQLKLGGIKGNISLSSFDGRYQIKLSQADVKIFDERLQAAKDLVDGCIHRWTEGSRIEIKALVEHAFQTDKEGKISLGRIYSLMQLDIDDAQWMQAMQALRDSMQVVSTTAYLRIYERNRNGKFEQLALDLAGV
ncbi:MAG: DUF3164 family protein [Methylobacter sp.]|uniref:DUF3164 family protein n=1 Tax=Candidatus Methylobacter titanis TaxID=3053457 RepID=A0AA43Q7Y4_9GAMM|nr:DUF3164 family protein [Candidatus Methylobacter titanis]